MSEDRVKSHRAHAVMMANQEDLPDEYDEESDDFNTDDNEAMFTDRRLINNTRNQGSRGNYTNYRGNYGNSNYRGNYGNRGGYGNRGNRGFQRQYPPRNLPQSNQRHNPANQHNQPPRHPGVPGKKCAVCFEFGCWSTNHSEESRTRAAHQLMLEMEGEPPGADLDGNLIVEGEAMITWMGRTDGPSAYIALANQASFHEVTGITNTGTKDVLIPVGEPIDQASIKPINTDVFITRYNDEVFHGIMIDTGASKASSCGLAQFIALQREQHVDLDTTAAGTARFKFGIGGAISQGTVAVETPIGKLTFHVIDADTPFLLSLQDLDQTGFHYDNQIDRLVKNRDGTQIQVIRRFGHPFLTWGNATIEAFVSQLDERQLR